MISKKTKISLSQLICLLIDFLDKGEILMLLEKHRFYYGDDALDYRSTLPQEEVKNMILQENNDESIKSLILEINATLEYFRSLLSSRYDSNKVLNAFKVLDAFNERWSDFEKCLLLDGFKLQYEDFISVDSD